LFEGLEDSMTLRLLCLALALLLGCAAASARPLDDPAYPAFTNVPELMDGFNLLYQQRFEEARAKFTEWRSRNPADPFGPTSIAASYLFEEFYRQGVLTSEFYRDDKRFLHGIEGKPDPERLKRFQQAIHSARTLATDLLQQKPGDPEALFALTLAAGMESNSNVVLLKKHLDGLKRMKEANDYAKQVLALRADALDAYVAPGSANYIIGCLAGPTRFFLWFGGVHGDKKLGMEQVRKTAEGGRYLRPFAKILLALAALREKQSELAKRLLRELTEEFPESPAFAAEYAKAEGRPVPAEVHP
jgi:tetratricopeptide (TPR) repeat protein